MKTIFLTSLLFISCAALTPQLRATPEQEQSLTEIRSIPDLDKTDIYSKSISWVARSYNSANNVIQLQNPETGTIICRGRGSFFALLEQRHYDYTMIIDVQDSRIRVRYENITALNAGSDIGYHWSRVSEQLNNLTESLLQHITSPDQNW